MSLKIVSSPLNALLLLQAQSDDEDTGPDVAVTVDAGRDGFMDEFFAQVCPREDSVRLL